MYETVSDCICVVCRDLLQIETFRTLCPSSHSSKTCNSIDSKIEFNHVARDPYPKQLYVYM